jgi:hypothetical protein
LIRGNPSPSPLSPPPTAGEGTGGGAAGACPRLPIGGGNDVHYCNLRRSLPAAQTPIVTSVTFFFTHVCTSSLEEASGLPVSLQISAVIF